MELWVGNSIIILFSFLHINTPHTAHVHFSSSILLVVIYIHYFLEHATYNTFSH